MRLARLDTVALRRTGLHGDGHAGCEEHRGRLAEPLSAGPSGRAGDGVPGRGVVGAAPADAAGPGFGAGGRSDRRLLGAWRSGPVVRGAVRRGGRRAAESGRPRCLRCNADVEAGRPGRVSSRERRRIPALGIRSGAPADRAALESRRRARGGIRGSRRLGHARQPGRRTGAVGGQARRTSPAASPRWSPISATGWQTPSC